MRFEPGSSLTTGARASTGPLRPGRWRIVRATNSGGLRTVTSVIFRKRCNTTTWLLQTTNRKWYMACWISPFSFATDWLCRNSAVCKCLLTYRIYINSLVLWLYVLWLRFVIRSFMMTWFCGLAFVVPAWFHWELLGPCRMPFVRDCGSDSGLVSDIGSWCCKSLSCSLVLRE